MSDASEEILEQLTCPICLGHPKWEVYQCQNGHPICSSCILPLRKCPTCRFPFRVSKIRCRVMESLLDIVELPCTNKDSGCTQRYLRKDLPDHHKKCGFRPVSLCKLIGYECNFVASTVAPLIQHLESCHNAKRWKNIRWKNYSPVSQSRNLYLQESAAHSDPHSSEKTWFLFLVTNSAQSKEELCFSCVPIHLHDGQGTAEQLRLQLQLQLITKTLRPS